MATRIKLRHRAQEWLADRITWVQYPNLRLVSPKRPFFKHQMPTSTRVTLVLLSLMFFAIAIPVAIAALFFLYAFLGACFGWIGD